MDDRENARSSRQKEDKFKKPETETETETNTDTETGNLKLFTSIMMACFASSFAFMVGYELGWASPVQKQMEQGQQGYKVNEKDFSLVGSIFPLGAAIACIPTGTSIDKCGHKPVIIIMGMLGAIGWVLMAFVKNYASLIVARLMHGLAAGAFCSAVPLYISEISYKKIRGTLTSTFQLQITIGILMAYTVGCWLNADMMAITGLIIAIVTTILFLFAPESPVFLVKQGNAKKAEEIMSKLRGKDYDIGPEMKEMSDALEEIQNTTLSLREAFRRKTTKKSLLYATGLMFFQQLSGINAVIFYTVSIFDAADAGLDANISTIIVGVIQVIATVIATLLVDRLGRRLLLIPSAFFMAVSTFALSIYFFLKENDNKMDNLAWLPLTALCVFIVMFSFGFGPVPWCIMGEICPSDIAGKCAAIAATVNWFLAFIVTITFPLIKNAIGAGPTFCIFSMITIGGLIFVWTILPETKGKSLEEIQQALE